MSERAKIVKINGPVVVGEPMSTFAMREMVQVGNKKLIGEVIAIQGDKGIVQVYEETEGLKRDEEIYAYSRSAFSTSWAWHAVKYV